MHDARHRRDTGPAMRGWRRPLALLVALSALLLPASTTFSIPGARPADKPAAQATAATLPHGRWVSRPAGPTHCLPAAGCRILGPTKG